MPFTTTIIAAPSYRLDVIPTQGNGLLARSQLMLNRLAGVRLIDIDGVIGTLDRSDLDRLDEALMVILHLDA